jgi:hypothetical protein
VAGPRYRAAEGLFHPLLWGKDTPSLPELVHKAIMVGVLLLVWGFFVFFHSRLRFFLICCAGLKH